MKVLLILADGMRPDGVIGHPVADHFMRHGAYCMNAQTVSPSVTLPCHMSLFHSVDPSRHGITTNTYVPQVRPVSGLFEQLAAAKKKCAMFYNWEELRDLCRPGSLALSEFVSGTAYGYEAACLECCRKAETALKGSDIDFAFLSRLIEALGNEYLIIYTADHGGHGRSHGTEMPEDMTIPIFFLGGPFEAGRKLDGISIMDIAPTILSLLGGEIPGEWEGNIIL